jgi:hypothetical protein
MPAAGGRFLKENAFLVAAVLLPVAVVAFFLLATIVPRMRVPPPGHDLVFRADRPYGRMQASSSVEFEVRDGSVAAVVRPVPANTYLTRPGLLLFDHRTLDVREIAFDVPAAGEGDPPRTLPVEALAGRRVDARAKAPDGYELDTTADRSPGIVGDLFGMRRHDRKPRLVKDGRVIPLALPAEYEYTYGVYPIGWIIEP